MTDQIYRVQAETDGDCTLFHVIGPSVQPHSSGLLFRDKTTAMSVADALGRAFNAGKTARTLEMLHWLSVRP